MDLTKKATGSLAETNPTCAHCHTHWIKGDCCSATIIPPDTQTEKSGLYSARAMLCSDPLTSSRHFPPHNPAKDLHQNHAECVSAGAVNTLERSELGALVRICDHHGSQSTRVKGSTCSGAPAGSFGHLRFLQHFTFQNISLPSFSKADLHLLSV